MSTVSLPFANGAGGLANLPERGAMCCAGVFLAAGFVLLGIRLLDWWAGPYTRNSDPEE